MAQKVQITVSIVAPNTGGIAGLQAFSKELRELEQAVKRLNGKYTLFIDKAAQVEAQRNKKHESMFITKAEFDAALSPAMRTGPIPAFRPTVAGGMFTPERLTQAYGAYRSAQADADAQTPNSAIIRNRAQYLAVYGGKWTGLPAGSIGKILNQSITESLKHD